MYIYIFYFFHLLMFMPLCARVEKGRSEAIPGMGAPGMGGAGSLLTPTFAPLLHPGLG